jgi:hypothetical protein
VVSEPCSPQAQLADGTEVAQKFADRAAMGGEVLDEHGMKRVAMVVGSARAGTEYPPDDHPGPDS